MIETDDMMNDDDKQVYLGFIKLIGEENDGYYRYGIRLMLLERMKKFDRVKGTESYHKIYETILDGDR